MSALASSQAAALRDPSAAERTRMADDGYLRVSEFFDAAAMADLLRWTEELERAPEEPGKHWVYHEQSLIEPGRKVIQRIENFCKFHQGFDQLICHGALSRWVGELAGGPVVLFKEKINFKMPDRSSPEQ